MASAFEKSGVFAWLAAQKLPKLRADTVKEVIVYADALKNYTLVFNDQVDEAKVNLRTIQALAKRYAMTENGGKYTEESWTAFEAAREAATDYAAKHSVSEYISDAEV